MKRGICFYLTIFTVLLYQRGIVASVVVPSTNCYVLDNSSHIYDFSNLIGLEVEYAGVGGDCAIRFCKDVEGRAQSGYVSFGKFEVFNYFVAGSDHYDFVQEYYNGDLSQCEITHDKRGRTTQLNIICGDCPNTRCEKSLLNLQFHVRNQVHECLKDSQWVFIRDHGKFFDTDQSHLSLYMTAIASLSQLVQKPTIKVFPTNGLEVTLSGSGSTGSPPTTLSPTMLNIDWRCETTRDNPYEVQLTIPVEGYDPIQFNLTKMCESKQNKLGTSNKGWAIFGIFSCIFFVVSTLFCCGGFIYKTQAQRQHGIDALPGMTILSACLETVSGGGRSGGYVGVDDLNGGYASQASWTRDPVGSPGSSRTSERKYGT